MPGDVVKVQQKVMVTVLEVDTQRNRIVLSMKSERPVKPENRSVQASKGKGDKKAKPSKKPAVKREKKPSRYEGNPFYEALKNREFSGKK